MNRIIFSIENIYKIRYIVMVLTMRYILSIDQGTTGTRAVIYDEEGEMVAWSYKRHKQILPRPGWVEHDPLEIWNNTVLAMREAVDKAGINPKEIVGVGVTNQRETTVVWEKETGRPIYNAIVWQDSRTINRCDDLKYGGIEDEIIRPLTGLYAHTYFSATKLEWILKHARDGVERAKKGELLFGTIDTWLIWNMTRGSENITPDRGGAHVTDPSNASRTMLMDIEKLEWCPELLEVFGIPENMLPVIKPSSYPESYGLLRKDILGIEIPVLGDLGDQQAALVGQAAFEPGEVKCTYGTGSFILMNIGGTPKLSNQGLITTVAYQFAGDPPRYALEGSIAYSGAAIEWLREGLGLIKDPRETEEICMKTYEEGSAGVYFVPAFSGLFAPYWDTKARGLIIGITRYTKKHHIVFAVLESIAFRVRDVVDAMAIDSGIEPLVIKVDGGVSRNDCLLQLQADILGKRVVRPVNIETTSLGAALAAGLASKVWGSISELKKIWRPDKVFEPKMPQREREERYKWWLRAVERALKWLNIEEGT